MDEAEVGSFDGTSISFSLMHTGPAPARRITSSADTITAPVKDGVAVFEFEDDRGGRHSGSIELHGDELLVRVDAGSGGDAPMQMNCIMVRDPYHDSREAEAAPPPRNFIGVIGTYSRISDSSDVIPAIVVESKTKDAVRLSITGSWSDKVFFRDLAGKVVSDHEVEVHLPGVACTLMLHWDNPGTITVRCTEGRLPGNLKALTEDPTYTNPEYMHVG